MICFPLDTTEYNSAIALGAWCGTRTRGVFAADNHFSVTASGGMTVTVGPGLGWLKMDTYWGVNVFEINPTVITLDLSDGALRRTDAICVRVNKSQNIGEIVFKKGAYSPQPPVVAPPARDFNYDEIYVATIDVRAGATEILQSDITDQRLNENYCGIMRDGVTGIPTQSLYDQWFSWMGNFTASAQSDFETWFSNIQAQLDGDVAGNLLNLINSLLTRFPNAVLGTVQALPTTTLYPHCALYESTWAYGIGGAGVGPAGGGIVSTIESDISHDESDITVTAPSQFSAYTMIIQLSDTMFAFLNSYPADLQSLVLQIS